MRVTITTRRQSSVRLIFSGVLVALVFSALTTAAFAGPAQRAAGGVPCPLSALELSTIVGKPVQRVNLSDADGDPGAQCSFSAVRKAAPNRLASPQVFLTVSPGNAADLRDLYVYYLKSHSKLATRPQVSSRPDLGQGAFTLRSATTPVTTAYFLLAKGGIGSLLVDVADAGAGRRDQATVEKVVTLVRSRLR